MLRQMGFAPPPGIPQLASGDINIGVESAHAQISLSDNRPNWLRVRDGAITGWAIGRSQVRDVSLEHQGQVLACATYGLQRPDSAPGRDLPEAQRCGFHISLQGLEFPADRPVQFHLVARTVDGDINCITCALPTEPSGAPQRRPRQEPILLQVEQAALHGNLLTVTGWAAAISGIIAVVMHGDEVKLGSTEPGLARIDVAAALPGYPHAASSGFAATLRLDNELALRLQHVRIEAFALDGAHAEVTLPVAREVPLPPTAPAGTRSDAAPASDIRFHCDELWLARHGEAYVSGWALAPEGIARITVLLDGVPIGEAEHGIARQDVGRIFAEIPQAEFSGFRFRADLGLPEDRPHNLRIDITTRSGASESFRFEQVQPREIAREAAALPAAGSIRGHIDGLNIENGQAGTVIHGGFTLTGWALARAGVAAVKLEIDGVTIGKPYYGMRRVDIAAAFPDWPDSLLSGFALSVPGKLLTDGTSIFAVTVTDRAGETLRIEFQARISKRDADLVHLQLRRKMPYAEVDLGLSVLKAAQYLPHFHVLVLAHGSSQEAPRLARTIASIRRQCYDRLTITIVSDTSAEFATKPVQRLLPPGQGKMTVRPMQAAIATLLTAAEGDLFCMLQAGDTLACDALLGLALANLSGPRADFIYGDDRRPDPVSGMKAPFFKPGWSPDLLLATNYIGRAWVASISLLRRLTQRFAEPLSRNLYDNVLRLTESASHIRHNPGLLLEMGGRASERPRCERLALEAALRRREIPARVLEGSGPGSYRIERRLARPGRVSIIIPSIGARGLVRTCIASIRSMTRYPDYEIIVVDNIRGAALTAEQAGWRSWFAAHADVALVADEPFNWSRLNNLGAARASGAYLLFLNDDIEITDPAWLDTLVQEAQREEVGVVGPRLLYPDGKVQHAGLFLSRKHIGTARHAFRFAEGEEPGYFRLAQSQRNVIGVTGACMLLRREMFDAISGFDEDYPVINNDVDFCLRLHDAGKLIVYTPHATLIHHELASRAHLDDVYDTSKFLGRWAGLCGQGDPFYNPRLSSDFDDYSIDDEILREVHAGYPIGDPARVSRILVVKLDHIGDMVTALPAIRRLRQRFPKAHITALVASASATITRLEPAIDATITFDFFNARSGLGMRRITRKALEELRAKLQACQFDLALDLRKLGDTRHILQLAGAPLVAGFDSEGQFPWLDFAQEWERDPPYVSKRNHVSADLTNFVDGLCNAFETERDTFAASARGNLPPVSPPLASEFAGLFASTYVCVHPAAGTPMRQWPAEHFAALIDLLVSEAGVAVALVGGPDERPIADAVRKALKAPQHVHDLVGRSRLAELPALISGSALFVGNNSGPQHIAAGLGVPTIGIHSGVVASEEWGPLGSFGLAIRREMSCGPCYKAKPEDCHRGLACLQTLAPYQVFERCRRLLLLRQQQTPAQAPAQTLAFQRPARQRNSA